MTEQDVQDWLSAFGRSWVDGDPDRVAVLFSETASYREAPFNDPMRGRRAIRDHWQKNVADAQGDVAFASQVWAVGNDEAIAGWQARFTERATGKRFELDGTFRLVFSGERGSLRCTALEGWWHIREL